MSEQHIFEQIEDYLHERMSEAERIAFEQKLRSDLSLSAKVEEARASDEAIHFACLADLKKTVGEDIKKIRHTSKWKNLTYWLLGSAILIGASTGIFISNNDPKKEIAATWESKKFSNDKITDNKKQNPAENELPAGQKKNPPVFIPSTPEDNEPSELTEKTLPENGEKNNTVNEETKISHNAKDNEDKKNTEPAPLDVKNNCNKEFEIRTEPSCKHQENGSITITADEGKEYIFHVDQHSINGSQGVFPNLSPGEHRVLVTYNKECTFTKIVKIEEKWCPLNQPFSFNPDYHEKWEIRYADGAEGKFIIYDRSGKEIYKNTFGSGNEYWDGTDMNGNVATTGTYAAILYYSDGRKEKVDLTIIR